MPHNVRTNQNEVMKFSEAKTVHYDKKVPEIDDMEDKSWAGCGLIRGAHILTPEGNTPEGGPTLTPTLP